MNRIPCMLMRGGSSKGLFFMARDLPEDTGARDRLLLAAMGIWFAWRAVNFPTFADFLIATEAELNKVSWTSRKRLVQDTIVVLVTLFLFTIFLLVVDATWGWVLSRETLTYPEGEGPAVAQLQALFLGHWQGAGGSGLTQAGFFPKLEAKGSEIVRIIGSSPQQEISRYYVTLISAIRQAQRSIWLTTAYFVPTFEEKHALIAAAERGVDVRLMLPAVSDASQAVAVARSHYGDLLEAGARIFEIDHVILHSKAVTIDGVWSAIGSSNLDHRSVLFNDEVDAIVLGRKAALGVERLFEDDRARAREIRREDWENRPLTDRISDFFQRTWQYLL